MSSQNEKPYPRLLGGSVYKVVMDDVQMFPDDEDPNQIRLLFQLFPDNGTRDHQETVPLSLLFSDQAQASAFLNRLAQEVLNQ